MNVNIRSLAWALIQYDWLLGVLIKKGEFVCTHTHTQRTPCEEEDRDLCDESISQGMPKLASKAAGARRGA